MNIITKEEFRIYEQDYFKALDEGTVFVYPTDTIYGIGCDATNEEAVQKIRDIKERPTKPFSIIAPSKEWILSNCEVTDSLLSILPGPYTLVVRLKHESVIAPNVTDTFSVGVRIPDHWIARRVEEYGKPIITTSVNKQGENHILDPEDILGVMQGKIDFAISEGPKTGSPSKIINTITGEQLVR